MTKENAKWHLDFIKTSILPLIANDKEHDAADRLERHGESYPEFINFLGKSRNENPDYCGNFEGGHIKTDIKEIVGYLEDFIKQ